MYIYTTAAGFYTTFSGADVTEDVPSWSIDHFLPPFPLAITFIWRALSYPYNSGAKEKRNPAII